MIQDLRFRRIEENLRKAFLTLLNQKDYNKISVTDICKEAKCSRNAFYLHYESKENLYNAILMDIIVDIEGSCRPVVENLADIGITESKTYVTNILTAVDRHRVTLKLLLENDQVNFSKHFKKIMIDAMIHNTKKFGHDRNDAHIHYFAGGISGFIEYWIIHTEDTLKQAETKIFKVMFP